MVSIYDYTAKGIDGKEINFKSFEGKNILIVNTASECGYTYQLSQLQELYDHYSETLEIVGFPSNNFGNQEPGTNGEIAYFCEKNHRVTFPLTEKVDVIGENRHMVYRFLTQKKLNNNQDYTIEWNFFKFLIDKEGLIQSMFPSTIEPISEDIISQL